ncbi:MAG: hypothetical protein HQ536_01230 [Parcubacteria group bacterium]|nr:hypothetical protein [Parcubacteria group bacterium]
MKILSVREAVHEKRDLRKEEARLKGAILALPRGWSESLESGDEEDAKAIEEEEKWNAEQLEKVREEIRFIEMALKRKKKEEVTISAYWQKRGYLCKNGSN